MTIVVMACQVQRLLVERGSDSTVHLVGHGQFDGLLDVLESSVTTLWLYLAELKSSEVDALHVKHVDSAVFEPCVVDAADSVDGKAETKQRHGLLHNDGIAADEGAALLVCLFPVQGANGNLWSDAGGVAHCHG